MGKKKSIVWKLSKEQLIEMVNQSNTLKDLVARVGLNNKSGSNDKTVKQCLEYHNIDWTVLTYKGKHNYGQDRSNMEVPHDELFSENSKHNRNVARRRIIRDNLIEYKCAICGQEPYWMGKPMTLVLDHINGVNNDHRLENLRFVCPNCNMQLDTNCGRKNKDTDRWKDNA